MLGSLKEFQMIKPALHFQYMAHCENAGQLFSSRVWVRFPVSPVPLQWKSEIQPWGRSHLRLGGSLGFHTVCTTGKRWLPFWWPGTRSLRWHLKPRAGGRRELTSSLCIKVNNLRARDPRSGFIRFGDFQGHNLGMIKVSDLPGRGRKKGSLRGMGSGLESSAESRQLRPGAHLRSAR